MGQVAGAAEHHHGRRRRDRPDPLARRQGVVGHRASFCRLVSMVSTCAVVAVGELVHTLALQLLADLLLVDAEGGQVRPEPMGAVQALGGRLAADLAVVRERLDVSQRHGVDRVRGRSAPRSTARRGSRGSWSRSRPTGAAGPGRPWPASASQRGPANAPARPRRRAWRCRSRPSRAAGRPARPGPPFSTRSLQLRVDQGVDPADEERGHAGHLAEVAAGGGQLLQAGQVGLDDLPVAVRPRTSG